MLLSLFGPNRNKPTFFLANIFLQNFELNQRFGAAASVVPNVDFGMSFSVSYLPRTERFENCNFVRFWKFNLLINVQLTFLIVNLLAGNALVTISL